MAYSYQSVVSNGTLTNLLLTVEYGSRSEISVYFNGVLSTAWTWVGTTEKQIAFTGAVPAGVTVNVRRRTDISAPKHLFSVGAQFKSSTLDDNTTQLLRAAQELSERAGHDVPEIIQDLDMHGHRLVNVGEPAAAGDAMTKGALLASGGASYIGAGLRTQEDKNSDVVSVKDFGAIGDGVANDTVALQAAIDSGAKRLHWPSGTYLVGAGGITGASGQEWVGAGKGRTTIKAAVAPGGGYDLVFFSGKSGFKVRGITFDGAGLLTSGAGHYPSLLPCLHISTCSDFVVADCEFVGFYNCGLLANVVFDGKITDNTVTRATAATFINHGIAVGGGVGGESYRLEISGNRLTKCQLSVNCHDSVITENLVTGWGFSAGINTQADPTSYRLIITGNVCWSSNQANDVSPYAPAGIENWASDSLISGNICYGNFGDGIDNGGARCTVSGNACYNNGGQGIYLLYQDATYNASSCLVAGNQLYDTRHGGARTQQAGYKEQSVSLTGINVSGNTSFNNINADVFAAVSRNVAAQPPWIAPTFVNSWSNYGGSTTAAGYYKDQNGIVRLRGTIKGGALSTSAFVLPEDLRPVGDSYFPVVSNSTFGAVLVNAAGGVIPATGSTSWVSLEGISFRP